MVSVFCVKALTYNVLFQWNYVVQSLYSWSLSPSWMDQSQVEWRNDYHALPSILPPCNAMNCPCSCPFYFMCVGTEYNYFFYKKKKGHKVKHCRYFENYFFAIFKICFWYFLDFGKIQKNDKIEEKKKKSSGNFFYFSLSIFWQCQK